MLTKGLTVLTTRSCWCCWKTSQTLCSFFLLFPLTGLLLHVEWPVRRCPLQQKHKTQTQYCISHCGTSQSPTVLKVRSLSKTCSLGITQTKKFPHSNRIFVENLHTPSPSNVSDHIIQNLEVSVFCHVAYITYWKKSNISKYWQKSSAFYDMRGNYYRCYKTTSHRILSHYMVGEGD